MQFKLASTLAFVTLAAATVAPVRRNDSPSNQCDTGSIQCCDSTQEAGSESKSLIGILNALGINVGTVTGLIGVTCTPVTVIGAGGNSCSAQPVCCTNDTFNGIVALGCTPVNINL